MKSTVVKKLSLTKEININELDKLAEQGQMSKNLVLTVMRELTNPDAPVQASRIFFLLMLNFKNYQIHKKDQLDLFREDWVNIENNYLLQITGRYTDFLPAGTKNYQQIKDAFMYMSNIRFSINSKETFIDAPLISNLVVVKKKGFKFALNAFWIEQFIDVSNYISLTKKAF